MSTPTKHRGTIVPMITPFTAEGRLDEPAAAALIARLAAHGLGVFVLGTTGEAASIPAPQRLRLTELAVERAGRTVPVYAGIGDNCPEDSIAAANAYLRIGVDAVVAHLPSYYPLKPAEMEAYFEFLAQETAGPLVLYNIPQTTHMSLPLEVIGRLSRRANVVGLKDSENSPERMRLIARDFAGRPDFSIFMGVSQLSVAALRLGFDGLVPSSGNLVPELWRDFGVAAAAQDWDAAAAIQGRLDAVAQVFQRGRLLGESLSVLKTALHLRRLCGPTMLPPLLTLDPAAREGVRRQLEAHGLHDAEPVPQP
jgi:2-dehydro-3-deoxy-D-pentonate aldolase